MKIKKLFIILLFVILLPAELLAQYSKGYTISYTIHKKDTIMQISMNPIFIFGKKVKKGRFYNNTTRLTNAIMICYPIAQDAQHQLYVMREALKNIKSEKERREYIKSVEKSLVKRYTPILRRMSFYQGAVLLKLIDRQTGSTGFSLLKELKNGMSAFFWQMIARLYGANLKLEYDGKGDDLIMESYVKLYEEIFTTEKSAHGQ